MKGCENMKLNNRGQLAVCILITIFIAVGFSYVADWRVNQLDIVERR